MTAVSGGISPDWSCCLHPSWLYWSLSLLTGTYPLTPPDKTQDQYSWTEREGRGEEGRRRGEGRRGRGGGGGGGTQNRE